MFNFFRKTPNPNNIKNFQDVLNLINFYIDEKQWEKAHKILDETIKIEAENAKKQINSLDKSDEIKLKKETENINIILKRREKQLNNLEDKLYLNEEKYRFIPERIKKYEHAITSIKTLTKLKEWKEVKIAVFEILKVEKEAFENLLYILEKEFKERGEEILFETEKKRQLEFFNKKENELKDLLNKSEILERKHNDKIENAKFQIRFKRIKSEVEVLTKTGKNPEALNILKHFLEENSTNTSVIKFFNTEKNKILYNIEKIKEIEDKKIKINIKEEAQKLIGKTLTLNNDETEKDNKTKTSFFKRIKKKINFYQKLKEKIKRKELIDEVTLLIEENKSLNSEIASKKLENIHKGLVKEINPNNVNGYDIYGKILGADKISGDTFGLDESDKKYNLFLGDATGHGVKAGLIITLLTRLFRNNVKKKKLDELAFEINNGLKQDLESRNFITGILFEIEKENKNIVKYVGMGHEPMLVYRTETNTVEKIIPGGLAAGIRMIKDISNVKIKKIILKNGDILLTYSDGVLESKGINGEYYGLQRLKDIFLKISQIEGKSNKIYKHLIDNLIAFRGGTAFDDDTTIMLLKRDEDSDIQDKNSDLIRTLANKENLDKKDAKKLVGKNKSEIFKELKKIKKDKQLIGIVRNLKKLYHIGEFLKLKQESIRYIKEGWVHKDINNFLKKAMDNEAKYKINLKNKKIENRYNIVEQLYKKGDYETVIREIEDIISKDGDI
ncbi:MAG: SpoIIE family protein phosphatase [Candidatus Gracilibacteria bacterium]|nr:SpoIIE family protein phosphatase [Candidatus Gracilibacteria bacterium]MDQ7022936.1 SpoIIE family protein phosphatase [Candidatus Gracilibacteria bacterium]